jgi:hypothetical protein
VLMLRLSNIVGRDVFTYYFVIVGPSDNNSQSFWIARALTNITAEPVEHLNCILI